MMRDLFLYNVISFSRTLKDEDGRALPLYLNSFMDPKPAFISYLQIPFIYIFSSNLILASRLPMVFLELVH